MTNQVQSDDRSATQREAPDAPRETDADAVEVADADAGQAATDAHQELHQALEDARGKADEHWNMLLRTQAELDNLRKRNKRDVENAHKFAVEKLASELLQVRDSLELGIGHSHEQADANQLHEGMELTLKILTQVMQKAGIEQIDPQGQPFNPELHQAMTLQENGELPPNTVISVMQKGYTLNGRLIRPAMVIVSKPPAAGG